MSGRGDGQHTAFAPPVNMLKQALSFFCSILNSEQTRVNVIGGHFMDQIVEKIKTGSTFRGTGDNYDMRILKVS